MRTMLIKNFHILMLKQKILMNKKYNFFAKAHSPPTKIRVN